MAERLTNIGKTTFWILNGDIASVLVDAVVVTDDTTGAMKGKAANAVKNAGGADIEEQSIDSGPHRLGEAWVTDAGSLGIKHVIHTASMTVTDTTGADTIRLSFRNSIRKADYLDLKSLGVPALGTGIGGFELADCARILAETVKEEWATPSPGIEEVLFVLYGEAPFNDFKRSFSASLVSDQEVEGVGN